MSILRNFFILGIALLPLLPAKAEDKLSKLQFGTLSLDVPASWLKHADARVVPAAPLYDAKSSAALKANPQENLKPEYPVMPEHTSVGFGTLPFYSGRNYEFSPEIMTHPVDAFTRIFDPENKPSPDVIAEFQLIKKLSGEANDQPTAKPLPFIPFLDASQQVTVSFKRLSFANGKGFRFVTQYGFEAGLINESQLVYIFQGITTDGKTYVLATFPVSLKGLPKADEKKHLGFDTSQDAESESKQDGYYKKASEWLIKNADQMTPSLETLDAVMSSIKTTAMK
jgi:hypothetical protein